MEVSIVWLITGVFLGFIFGYLTCALLTTGKISDLDTEIWDLRTQRQLLKEEIFRLSQPKSKPSPRKKRQVRKPKKS